MHNVNECLYKNRRSVYLCNCISLKHTQTQVDSRSLTDKEWVTETVTHTKRDKHEAGFLWMFRFCCSTNHR